MEKRRTSDQMRPRMSFLLPSTISVRGVGTNMSSSIVYYRTKVREHAARRDAPSGPMLVKWTPISLMRSSALAAFSTFWTRRYGW
mgnify:CR=1 FL=1